MNRGVGDAVRKQSTGEVSSPEGTQVFPCSFPGTYVPGYAGSVLRTPGAEAGKPSTTTAAARSFDSLRSLRMTVLEWGNAWARTPPRQPAGRQRYVSRRSKSNARFVTSQKLVG